MGWRHAIRSAAQRRRPKFGVQVRKKLRSYGSILSSVSTFRTIASMMKFLLLLICIVAVVHAQGPGAQSPASQQPPRTVTPQSYPPEQVQGGQVRFASQCGFCHGRDAAGGETGPDLTRSILVAEDSRGDKIREVVRSGRVDKGMPSFEMEDADLEAIVAFIHDQKTKADSLGGGRRAVDVSDLETGNVDAGRRYFNGAG